MNDQKNKQQHPSQHGGKQDNDQQGQKPNKQDQDKQKDKQHVQGDVKQPDQPDKKTQIDDNPDETKKKIPNMQNKH